MVMITYKTTSSLSFVLLADDALNKFAIFIGSWVSGESTIAVFRAFQVTALYKVRTYSKGPASNGKRRMFHTKVQILALLLAFLLLQFTASSYPVVALKAVHVHRVYTANWFVLVYVSFPTKLGS